MDEISMTAEHRREDAPRFEVKSTSDSHFSWIRTRLSLERTLMSWVRTATALIGFGFTIVQFFERFKHMEGVAEAWRPDMPRHLGIALISTGILALVVSVWQYHVGLRYLWSGDFKAIAGVEERPWRTPLFTVAIVLSLIGLVALAAVFLRFV